MRKIHTVDYQRDADTRRRMITYMGNKGGNPNISQSIRLPYSVPRNRSILYVCAALLLLIGLAGIFL